MKPDLDFLTSDLNFIVKILPLNDNDISATINNQAPRTLQSPDKLQDVGIFFDLLSGELNHSILDLTIKSKLTFTINSLFETQFIDDIRVGNSNRIASPLVLGSESDVTTNTDANYLIKIVNFMKTLVGRPIVVFQTKKGSPNKIVFYGYIESNPGSISVRSGTQFTLICSTVLSQLSEISSNASWQDSTQTYGNVFTTVSGNTVNYQTLLTQITQGSLSQKYPILSIDGNARPMPDTVWAVILPNKDRLSVLKEILVPYSRIIYQKENSEIVVQPLFIDDKADPIFNVNCYNNFDATWINYTSRNAASRLPNRMDVLYAATTPVNLFGDPQNNLSQDVFASTPKINKSTNKIQPSNIPGVLDYSTVYSTSVRLYNSGKFTMPLMITLSLDNSLLLNSALMNSILNQYKSSDLSYSNIYVSGNTSLNGIALLYSQIFMAQANTQNYNATCTYDYNQVSEAESPLGKIVSIFNDGKIDYHDMIVMNTSLSFNVDSGTLYSIETAPLLSICGVWSSIGSNA